jgi:aminopeptidase N
MVFKPVRFLSPNVLRLSCLFFLAMAVSQAQTTHYTLKLTPDFDRRVLRGQETVEFERDGGTVELQKQAGLQISQATSAGGEVNVKEESVSVRLRNSGPHKIQLQYTAASGRGIMWFPGEEGLDTAFYCEAWMVCDADPGQRATLTMEIVVRASSGLNAVAPGQLTKQWQEKDGVHFLFEQIRPVQTYLFSFGIAKLQRSEHGRFALYAADSAAHPVAFERTAKAYLFLSSKAGIGLENGKYTQASMLNGIAQEAASMALMPKDFFHKLEEEHDDGLMSHELAHQWWGVQVGIRSWSDFWLNEGMADFMQDAFLEQEKGRAEYVQVMEETKQQLEKLRAAGQDRPLHWEGWKDAHGALGKVPYVKGALFLDRLRSELGEEKFWRGLALYTTRNAGRLVDSTDFEKAMEEASGRDLKALFEQAVYR